MILDEGIYYLNKSYGIVNCHLYFLFYLKIKYGENILINGTASSMTVGKRTLDPCPITTGASLTVFHY